MKTFLINSFNKIKFKQLLWILLISFFVISIFHLNIFSQGNTRPELFWKNLSKLFEFKTISPDYSQNLFWVCLKMMFWSIKAV
ncbi:hypothetical protein C4M98_06270, partial [Mycoplasmopsis pullorum]